MNQSNKDNLKLYNQMMGIGSTPIVELQGENTEKFDNHVAIDNESDGIVDMKKKEKKKMKKIISNINNSLDKIKKKKKETDTESENDISKPEKQSIKKKIYDKIKEPFLLFGLYILLSQSFIKSLFGMYFTQINPNDSGQVSIYGVLIYGTLLTSLFMLIRYFM
jgi:hypothetical protein